MAKSIAFAADPSQLASLLLSYIPAVCAFVAPRQPGASAAIIDRLRHSRALRVESLCSANPQSFLSSPSSGVLAFWRFKPLEAVESATFVELCRQPRSIVFEVAISGER